MANLEACPTCGNQTSENAHQCPVCGEPLSAGWAEAVRERNRQAAEAARLAEEIAAVTLKRSKRKKRLFWVLAATLVAALFVGPEIYEDYRMRNLKEIDPDAYQNRIDALEAQVAKVPASEFDENIRLYKELQTLDPENNRYAEKMSYYIEKKTVAEKTANAKVVDANAAEEEEKKRKGFHCLSSWNGSHRMVQTYVEKRMREPDSFEHIGTWISPVNETGKHTLTMRYRARNGFGGMSDGVAIATINNADCSAAVVSIE